MIVRSNSCWIIFGFYAVLLCRRATGAFQSRTILPRVTKTTFSTRNSSIHLRMGKEPEKNNVGPLNRVLSPKIDDKGLPLTDVFVAQIIGPSLQVFWLTLNGAPRPTWLQPIFDNTFYQYRGALLAPTLIHGAGLACCWLLGALFARAYEEEAIDPTVKGYSSVLWRIFQAGCFASGALIFSTQVDLLFEFGRYVQLGESETIDVRLLQAYIEVINDIAFEVLAVVPIRLFLAASIARNKEE